MAFRINPLALWLCLLSLPSIALAQALGDRELIPERQEPLLQEQQRRLDELQQLPGETPQLQTAPVERTTANNTKEPEGTNHDCFLQIMVCPLWFFS